MSSIKCSQCGLVNWATQGSCKRCGMAVSASASHSEPAYQTASTGYAHEQSHQSYGSTPTPGSGLKSGLAIASLVLAAMGMAGGPFLIGIPLLPVALILGIVALVKANRHPFQYGGKGMAIAGIAVSSVMMFLIVPIIAAIAIPNLMAARRAANEGSAIAIVRKLADAESRYTVQQATDRCGTLSELKAVDYIDQDLATGEKNGYKFEVSHLAESGCQIFATPLTKNSGSRSFYFSTEDGLIRTATKEGMRAGPNDAVIK